MSNVLHTRLLRALDAAKPRIVACSGGIDSLLLAIVASRAAPEKTRIVHALSPAVQRDGSQRVQAWAEVEGFAVSYINTGEFADEQYLINPANRCYHCKSHLYTSLNTVILNASNELPEAVVLSGTNLDDLGEYRPGLEAASEAGVRHPYVEAQLGKEDIRSLARHLNLDFADLPSSPCLASRLYTGTRVTAERLRAVESGENLIRQQTGVAVVRCRIRDDEVLIEVGNADRNKLTSEVVARVAQIMQSFVPTIIGVTVDALPYQPGRSFIIHRQL